MTLSSRPGEVLPNLGNDNPANDICPVCKMSRYLNKDLEFLVNPECYHPMCTNCVNRLFNEGPNQCPYATCHKTLRRKGFHPPWFGDLEIEREVDIRKRVAAVLNKVEDDFETLRDYNNYLEWVEDLTARLVSRDEADRRAAERELLDWEQQHRAEIEANKKRRGEADEMSKLRAQAEEQAAQQRRLQSRREDEEEKARAAKFREEMLDGLANGEEGTATQTINRILLKKRGQGRPVADTPSTSLPGLSIRGLKERRRRIDHNLPYDPFGGLHLAPTRYALAEDLSAYRNDWLDTARTQDDFRVGGYSVEEYLSRAMYEALSGLGVFLDEERADGVEEDILGRMDVDEVF